MKNKLTYTSKSYSDDAVVDTLISATVYVGSSLPAAELAVDTMTAEVQDHRLAVLPLAAGSCLLVAADGYPLAAQGAAHGLDEYDYGTPVRYDHAGRMLALMYLESIERTGRYRYQLSCVSGVGLLLTEQHYGGIYDGQPMSQVVKDIMGGSVSYTLDATLGATPIYGWLPKASRRDNLRDVLFATGGRLRKDTAGQISIVPYQQEEPYEIPVDAIFLGGSVTGGNPASAVQVTEHSYVPRLTGERSTLYEGLTQPAELVTPKGATVQGTLVELSEPAHSLAVENAEILESGANYAVLSGSSRAVLTGLPYVHAQRILTRKLRSGGVPNVVSSSACTLVNLLNAELVADRLAAYYGSARTVSADLVVTTQKPGDAVTFADPFGEACTGYIGSMEMTMSAIVKARTELIVGFVPPSSGNYYHNYTLITEDCTFTVPEDCRGKLMVVLCNGGQGGCAGYRGEPGKAGESETIDPEWALPNETFSGYHYGSAGEGGAAGAGGQPGKLLESVLEVAAWDTFAVTLGLGGSGGTPSEELDESPEGAEGGETRFGTLSGNDGQVRPDGYLNPLTGERYAVCGDSGIPGGSGDAQDKYGALIAGTPVVVDGVSYVPGAAGEFAREDKSWDYASGFYQHVAAAAAAGGSGGGAAAGTNGPDGSDGEASITTSLVKAVGGCGNGATPTLPARTQTTPGSGGHGGHGGGGAGGHGASQATHRKNTIEGVTSNYANPTVKASYTLGTGGIGGQGGTGAKGFVLVFW